MSKKDNTVDMLDEYRIYTELCDKFNMTMNRVSLCHLLHGVSDVDGITINKQYESCTPMQFLTIYKINLMFDNGEIDEATRNRLISAYKNYYHANRRIYYSESEIQNQFKEPLETGLISVKEFELLVDSKIRYWKNWEQKYYNILSEYKLPITFDLNNLISNCSGVTTDKSYQVKDELSATYKKVKQYFYHIFYNSPVSSPLEQLINPTKTYGVFAKYSVIEFLTIYKIRRMFDQGKITAAEMNSLIIIYNSLLNTNDAIKKNEDANALPSLVANQREYEEELAKYNLPLEFDLDGIIDSYGKDKTNDNVITK